MRAERAPAFPEIGTRPVVSVRLPTPTRAAYRFRGIVGGLRLRLRRRRGPPSCGYQPRAADHGVLYRVIDEHLEPFLDAAAHHADGHRLPKFVEQEFRDFLTCGVLAHGFARLRCGDCAFERLVPFSCKGQPRHWAWANLMRRAFDIDVLACPRCGGRLRLLGTIEDPAAIRAILDSLAASAERVDRAPPPVTLEPTTLATQV
jgi:Transposase zinc-binding domain